MLLVPTRTGRLIAAHHHHPTTTKITVSLTPSLSLPQHLSTIARDFDVKLRKLSNALIALQGPLSWRVSGGGKGMREKAGELITHKSYQILRQFVTADLKEMHFLNSNFFLSFFKEIDIF